LSFEIFDVSLGSDVDSMAKTKDEQGTTESDSPKALSDQCLRELMGKASFGSMRSVLQPVLRHCDLHHLWTPPAEYAISSFRAIMYSIQTQYSYVVIQASDYLLLVSAHNALVNILYWARRNGKGKSDKFALRQNHFICPYFSFKTKLQFSSLQMAKF
jgi:hypothetical protein